MGLFSEIKVARASDDIVEQIKEVIFAGKLRPGDRLPSERELVRAFGVSRVTIREAVRVLEAAGILRVKTGVRGGSFIAEVSSQIVVDSLRTLYRLQKVSLRDLAEARLIIETALAGLAAERADADDLERMEKIVEEQRQAVEANVSDSMPSWDFHIAIAKAAKNSALVPAVESFWFPLKEMLPAMRVVPEVQAEALRFHERILAAIRRRDADTARRVMGEHMRFFESHLPKVLDPQADLPFSIDSIEPALDKKDGAPPRCSGAGGGAGRRPRERG